MTGTTSRMGTRHRFSSIMTTESIGVGLLRVSDGRSTRGYIEEVGTVFVALAGARYDRSVEVAQTLSIESAIAALSTAPAA